MRQARGCFNDRARAWVETCAASSALLPGMGENIRPKEDFVTPPTGATAPRAGVLGSLGALNLPQGHLYGETCKAQREWPARLGRPFFWRWRAHAQWFM
jgi:hypothetical protein